VDHRGDVHCSGDESEMLMSCSRTGVVGRLRSGDTERRKEGGLVFCRERRLECGLERRCGVTGGVMSKIEPVPGVAAVARRSTMEGRGGSGRRRLEGCVAIVFVF